MVNKQQALFGIFILVIVLGGFYLWKTGGFAGGSLAYGETQYSPDSLSADGGNSLDSVSAGDLVVGDLEECDDSDISGEDVYTALGAGDKPKKKCKPNPCNSGNCGCCMAYAEAGGTGDGCIQAVLCVIKNRIDNKDFSKPVDSCAVVSQGQGKQFHPYRCVKGDKENTKYCQCCSGKFDKKKLEEKAEADRICDNLKSCGDCSGANTFETGTPSGFFSTCKVIAKPCGCTDSNFHFYKCEKKEKPKKKTRPILDIILRSREEPYRLELEKVIKSS